MGGKVKNPKEYYKKRRETHKEQIGQAQKKYVSKPETKEKLREWYHKQMETNPKFVERQRERIKKYYYNHQDNMRDRNKRRSENRKIEVLAYYGGGKVACVSCGFSDIRALSIDHVNGNGCEHRKEVGNGIHLYNWLVKNNYPEGYQTFCMNCQFIKRVVEKECTGPEH
uniref:Uncharacterized protein n=1 Tax=viral metagenome TaxID=1070528 RepID=A0A6H1ZII1_9ZZZZ